MIANKTASKTAPQTAPRRGARGKSPFCAPIQLHAGDYADAVGSDVVVITSGLPRKPGQNRLGR